MSVGHCLMNCSYGYHGGMEHTPDGTHWAQSGVQHGDSLGPMLFALTFLAKSLCLTLRQIMIAITSVMLHGTMTTVF